MDSILSYLADETIINAFLSGLSDIEIKDIITETDDGIVLKHDGPFLVYTKDCDQEMLSLVFGDDIPVCIDFDTFTFNLTNDYELRNGNDGFAAHFEKCMIIYGYVKDDIFHLHNINGPATISMNSVSIKIVDTETTDFFIRSGAVVKWYKDGKIFRDVGPAKWHTSSDVEIRNASGEIKNISLRFSVTWNINNRQITAPTLVDVCKSLGIKFDMLATGQSIFADPVDQIAFMQHIKEELPNAQYS